MKKIINSLNEEMNRIKSLFTEERMFGNLVEQDETKPKEGDTEEKEGKDNDGKKCVEDIKTYYKEVTSSGDSEKWGTENTDKIERIEHCLTTYSKKFEKEGLFRAGDEANKLKEILKLEITPIEKKKEEFTIKDKYGKVIMTIKNKEGNNYVFRGKLKSDLFNNVKSGGIGKRKYFDPHVENYIRQTMNLDSSKTITILKGINLKGLDTGTFMVS